MTALALERDTPRMGAGAIPSKLSVPLAASTKLWRGSIAVLNISGYAVPASTALNLTVAGVCSEATVDNTDGSAGDLRANVERGVFRVGNSAGDDAITLVDVLKPCYLVDDQTVARTDANGTWSYAGRVALVDSTGVWVEFGASGGASGGAVDDVLLEAGGDLSAKQYYFVTLDSNGDVVVANAAGEDCFGVLQNAPASGAIAIVRRRGRTSLIGGGVVAAGDKIAATSAGKSKTAVATTTDVATVTAITAADPSAALGAFTDPPAAGEMAALRTLINELRTLGIDLKARAAEIDTAFSTAQATTGSFVMGWALTVGAADTAHAVMLEPMGAIPGTPA